MAHFGKPPRYSETPTGDLVVLSVMPMCTNLQIKDYKFYLQCITNVLLASPEESIGWGLEFGCDINSSPSTEDTLPPLWEASFFCVWFLLCPQYSLVEWHSKFRVDPH